MLKMESFCLGTIQYACSKIVESQYGWDEPLPRTWWGLGWGWGSELEVWLGVGLVGYPSSTQSHGYLFENMFL